MVVFGILLACTVDNTLLTNEELATRLSLDLRGVRPTISELNDAGRKQWYVDETIDLWMKDSRFPRVSAERWAKVFNTRQDQTLYSASDFNLPDEFSFAYSVGEEPIRVIEEIIKRNLPWTDLVTADWTVLNQDLHSIYPATWVDAEPESRDEWKVARYSDGRPSAGVLVSNGLWWRYETSLNNASRRRANQISRIFLCRDYLEVPVSFEPSINLTNEEAIQSAIEDEPSCAACHSTLDPLASFLGGVFARRKSDPLEMIMYHPERERLGFEHLGVEPSWNGVQGNNLEDLGILLIDDTNFSRCATQHILNEYLGNNQGDDIVREWSDQFSGDLQWSVPHLIRSVLLTESYKLRWQEGDSKWRQVSPEQMESQVEELTGFRLSISGYPALRAEKEGFSAMVGGANFSVPLILVQQELAHLASRFWMMESNKVPFEVHNTLDADERIILLHRMILGILPSSQELIDLKQYIKVLDEEYEPIEIWSSVATVIMQDPRFLVY